MLFLYDRYGIGFMSALHRDGDAPGPGRRAARRSTATRPAQTSTTCCTTSRSSTLVDQYVGTARRQGRPGSRRRRVTSQSLNSTVNLGNPAAYAAAGAPANGADYVGLRARQRRSTCAASDLRSLSFNGAKTLAPEPLKWTVVDQRTRPRRATRRCGRATPATWTRAAVTQVTVPPANPTLPSRAAPGRGGLRLRLHGGLDRRRQDLHGAGQRQHGRRTVRPGAQRRRRRLGRRQTFDLSAYAGKSVLIGFRYVSDGGVNDGGWYVDDVKVGGTADQRRLQPVGVQVARPRPGRRRSRPGTSGWSGSTRPSTRRWSRRSTGAVVHPERRPTRHVPALPAGGGHRRLRRADRAGPAAGALHADRQRCGAAGWRGRRILGSGEGQSGHLLRSHRRRGPTDSSSVGPSSSRADARAGPPRSHRVGEC